MKIDLSSILVDGNYPGDVYQLQITICGLPPDGSDTIPCSQATLYYTKGGRQRITTVELEAITFGNNT